MITDRLQAFEVTKWKWEWIIKYSPNNWDSGVPECGFCLYKGAFYYDCYPCPIPKVTGDIECYGTPFRMKQNLENALLEYMFIHFVALFEGIIDCEGVE